MHSSCAPPPLQVVGGDGGGEVAAEQVEDEELDEEMEEMFADLMSKGGGRGRGLTVEMVEQWDQVKEILETGALDDGKVRRRLVTTYYYYYE